MLFQALWEITLSERERNHGIEFKHFFDGKIIIFLNYSPPEWECGVARSGGISDTWNDAQTKETITHKGQKYNVSLCSEKSQVSRYGFQLRLVSTKIFLYVTRRPKEPEYHEVKNELDYLSLSQLMDGSVRILLGANVLSKINQKLNDYNQMFGFSVGDKRGRQFGECRCHKTVDAGTLRSPSGSKG